MRSDRLKQPLRGIVHHRVVELSSTDYRSVLWFSLGMGAASIVLAWWLQRQGLVALMAPAMLAVGAIALAALATLAKWDRWALHFWVDSAHVYFAVASKGSKCKKATLIPKSEVTGLEWRGPDADRRGAFLIYRTGHKPLEVPVSVVSAEEARTIALLAFPHLPLQRK